MCVTAGETIEASLHYPCEAAARVRSHISPGPYRSFRELSLAGSVDPDIWCPPTFVGNSGIECSNGLCGFALCVFFVGLRPRIAGGSDKTPVISANGSAEWPPDDRLRRGILYAAASP